MKKVVIAGLLVSAALVAIATYLLPRRFVLEKSIVVTAPPSYLYEEIIDLERWPLWSYWLDHTTEITYGDSRVGIEASGSWQGARGSGNVTLVAQRMDEMVRARLNFGSRRSATYEFRIIPDTLRTNQTRLVLKAEVTAPEDTSVWSRWTRFLLANRLASSLTHSLASLRKVAENKPVFENVTEELLAPSYYVSIRRKHQPESAVEQIRTLHELIIRELKSVGSEAAGHPFCLFGDSLVMDFAVPVAPDARVPESYRVLQHYSGRAIRGTDHGDYNDIARTHHEVQRYIQYKDYVINGTPWEVYTIDPDEDPVTWVTEVYYPITTKGNEQDRL